MGLPTTWNWELDGWIVAAGILCSVASALLGNFLVLRRMSMLGDAISHAVLPGLAAAFFLSDNRSSWPMFLGAVVVGVLTAFFTEWIRGVGKVDEGASMGVVFTSLFALGLVMIVQAADHVDLDPGCVLYGAIELTPLDKVAVLGIDIPRAVLTLGAVTLINAIFVGLFYKELKISSFDPALATTSGFSATLMHYLLMILVAVTAVASFESVGNILVVAMFVVPAAAAYMLSDRLHVMIGLSICLATGSAILGHLSAITVPGWFGYQSTNTAGMMAVAVGLVFLICVALGPTQGILVRVVRRQLLSNHILADDIVALLYRREEKQIDVEPSLAGISAALLVSGLKLRGVLQWLLWNRQIVSAGYQFELSHSGRERARSLVRSHRLWEQYLVTQAGVEVDRIHDKAERFEHFTNPRIRAQLDEETGSAQVDPHGRPIPEEQIPQDPDAGNPAC